MRYTSLFMGLGLCAIVAANNDCDDDSVRISQQSWSFARMYSQTNVVTQSNPTCTSNIVPVIVQTSMTTDIGVSTSFAPVVTPVLSTTTDVGITRNTVQLSISTDVVPTNTVTQFGTSTAVVDPGVGVLTTDSNGNTYITTPATNTMTSGSVAPSETPNFAPMVTVMPALAGAVVGVAALLM